MEIFRHLFSCDMSGWSWSSHEFVAPGDESKSKKKSSDWTNPVERNFRNGGTEGQHRLWNSRQRKKQRLKGMGADGGSNGSTLNVASNSQSLNILQPGESSIWGCNGCGGSTANSTGSGGSGWRERKRYLKNGWAHRKLSGGEWASKESIGGDLGGSTKRERNDWRDGGVEGTVDGWDSDEGQSKGEKGLSRRVLYMVVILISTGAYWNSLNGDFVHDDLSAIKTNGDVTGQNSIWKIFLNDFWGKPMADRTSHKSYRPFTILTFRLNRLLHGLEPTGYHVFNLVLHSLVCVLFVKICLEVARTSKTSALLAGAHFASHPVHTEAVTGVVGRADLLAALFLLLSFHFYCRYQKEVEKTGLILASIVLAFGGMLSKEHGITVLGINFTWDVYLHRYLIKNYIFTRKWNPKMHHLFRRLFIVGLGTVGFLTFRIVMLQGSLPEFSDQDNPASFTPCKVTRLRTFTYLPVFNFWLLLAPISLNYDWQMGSIPLVEKWTDLRNIPCLIFYTALVWIIAYVVYKVKKTRREVVLALSFLIIPFIPASNLLFRVGFVVAERVLYIPRYLIASPWCCLSGSWFIAWSRLLPHDYRLEAYALFWLSSFWNLEIIASSSPCTTDKSLSSYHGWVVSTLPLLITPTRKFSPGVMSKEILNHFESSLAMNLYPTIPSVRTTVASRCSMIDKSEQVKHVLDMLVSTLSPLSHVEDPYFRLHHSFLNSNYQPTTRKTVHNLLIEEADRLDASMAAKLQRVNSAMCLLTDIWTSKGQKGVILSILTYIDDDFNLQTALLDLTQIKGHHDAENIAKELRTSLANRGLALKRVFTVTDSGSNVLAAIRLLDKDSDMLEEEELLTESSEPLESDDNVVSCDPENEVRMDTIMTSLSHMVELHTQYRCVAHSLQSCIRVAFSIPEHSMVSMVLNYATKLVATYRKRLTVSDAYREICKRGLIAAVPTRWNSYVDCLIRLTDVDVFTSIYAVIRYEKEDLKSPDAGSLPRLPEVDDYVLFVRLISLLSPFSIATDSLQGQGILIHQVLPQIARAYHALQSLPDDQGDTFGEFRKTLMQQLTYRFSALFRDPVMVTATILSNKNKRFFRKYAKVFGFANPFNAPSQLEAEDIVRSTLPPSETVAQDPLNASDSSNSFDSMLLSPFKSYMNLPSTKQTVSDFWRHHRTTFPGLFQAARFIFCIPPTTASVKALLVLNVEREFSTCGAIVSKLRSSMNVTTLHAFMRYRREIIKADAIPYNHKTYLHKKFDKI